MAKRKRQPGAKRTTLPLGVDDYDVLKDVAEANGWTVAEATRRAVHALVGLNTHVKSMAEIDEQAGGTHGPLLRRVWREVDPGLLARPMPMHKAETNLGNAIIVDDALTFLEQDDVLVAQLQTEAGVEMYEVTREGKLAKPLTEVPLPAPQLS